ncbi:CYTH domain-containing protein [Pseudobutyrivibrio xylanivorans]|uniref:CYTH domain-containing protein n=1 Tax=Pseudobutyrivibrio xylanivorans DSM 14809 TaxID=1123012 RepID=A0A1M6GMN2_PSEXY|nr:CYTH domain-containing protein [Pseudobutyrivibrio xylanivorans]SHJ11227.1 CYTH domain-containing protein [Pseudobutyrivibrio xylanivorans DSM 14809]
MEIERKFLIKELPDLSKYDYVDIEQGYLCTHPVVRIRKKNNKYILTYKGSGLMAREEIEAELTKEAYEHLREKIDGHAITKRRYLIPFEPYTIELDVFEGHKKGLNMAEVEFPSVEEANSFVPPEWFGEDVTNDKNYHNSNMI